MLQTFKDIQKCLMKKILYTLFIMKYILIIILCLIFLFMYYVLKEQHHQPSVIIVVWYLTTLLCRIGWLNVNWLVSWWWPSTSRQQQGPVFKTAGGVPSGPLPQFPGRLDGVRGSALCLHQAAAQHSGQVAAARSHRVRSSSAGYGSACGRAPGRHRNGSTATIWPGYHGKAGRRPQRIGCWSSWIRI